MVCSWGAGRAAHPPTRNHRVELFDGSENQASLGIQRDGGSAELARDEKPARASDPVKVDLLMSVARVLCCCGAAGGA